MPFRRRFRGRSRGTSRPIRNREWSGFTTAQAGGDYDTPRTVIMTPGQAFRAWIFDPLYCAEVWDEPTIVRMLLIPSVYLDASPIQTTGDYRQTLRGGIITWKHGINQAPAVTDFDGLDPGDPQLDWLWWGEYHFNHYSTISLGTQQQDFTGGSGTVNVKTKRKLELGYGLAGAFYNIADSTPSGVGINLHLCGRILLLNH